MSAVCESYNPLRFLPRTGDCFADPARCWLRCGHLLKNGRLPQVNRDSAFIFEAFSFRQTLERCQTDSDRDQLAQRFPAMAEAHRFRETATPLRRAELEARLLANEEDCVIGPKVGLPPATVAVYHDLFFTVRPYLKAELYILNVVLGPKVHHGLQPDDHELLVKMLGYAWGSHGVDTMLDHIRNLPVVPKCLDGLDLEELKRLRTRMRFKIGILLETTPASAASAVTWLQLKDLYDSTKRMGEDVAGLQGALHISLDLMDVLEKARTWTNARGAEPCEAVSA